MTLSKRTHRMLLTLAAITAVGASTASAADAAVSIRGMTPDPGLRHYLQTRPDDRLTLTNKQRNPADPNQRWAQTSVAGGLVFKNEVGSCIVDFGFSANGTAVRANACNPFTATDHFRWTVEPGSRAGTIQLRNQNSGRYITFRDRRAFIAVPGHLGSSSRHRDLKLGTF